MLKFDSPLQNVKVASPCPADWNAMSGDERKRFCGECKLNVYNLSGMTTYDAENLLRNSEGSICVRYFQRSDGTILTMDCPVGWARIKQKVTLFSTAAFSLFLLMFSAVFHIAAFSRNKETSRFSPIPINTPTPNREIMGAMPIPTPKKTVPKVATVDENGGKYVLGKKMPISTDAAN